MIYSAEVKSKVIKLQGVNKHFGHLHVLKDINLKVSQGEKLVVIGPSGSGKSTLIRCINMLEKPNQGSVTVDGVEITANKAQVHKVRETIGMVFQQFNLYPHKTVLENLTLAPILIKKIPQHKAEETGMA
jgi:aspartate/glutamate/glutamine transport system ATP-binding protein